MDKFMAWMENSFAPKMNKLAHNPWVAAVQQAILTAMPMIFIGSFVTVLTAFGGLIEGFPDFSPINTFSIGLLSVFLSYLVPYLIMEKKRNNKTKKEAGLAGIALYLLIAGPVLDGDAGTISFTTSALGNGGMIAALMAGLFAGFVMNLFAKHSFFKEIRPFPISSPFGLTHSSRFSSSSRAAGSSPSSFISTSPTSSIPSSAR